MSDLHRTPLHDLHLRLGARMVPFAGFAMPVQYTSILREHEAVRRRAGLFDVSHMGQIHLSGPRAIEAGERLLSSPVASLREGRVRYGLLCNEAGGVVDDVTFYRTGPDRLFLCVNASNIDKDEAWLREHLGADVALENRSAETAMLALQGPEAAATLADLAGPAVAALTRFAFTRLELVGAPALISRTGYTGSDGFELYLPAEAGPRCFEELLAKGDSRGVQPAGLGARDTLRLEAALPLYGHELDDETTPLQAGLGRFVKRDQGGFIGAEAIERRAGDPEAPVLAGFAVLDKGVARAGHPVLHGDLQVGRVTSGGPSPSLGRSIGLAYVPPDLAAPGTRLAVEVRGRALPVEIVRTPFVGRGAA